MSDQIAEITALAEQAQNDAMATWSDDKRKDFVATFTARVNVARYLLIKTADFVTRKAKEKHYISEKHLKMIEGFDFDRYHIGGFKVDDLYDGKSDYDSPTFIGGRPKNELKAIAKEQADEIIAKLPSLIEAVRIISPECASMIDKKEKLFAKGKELFEQVQELTGPLNMEDLDQDMSIGDFRQLVKEREKKRTSLLSKMDEIGKDGQELEGKINKFLYEGLPGLSNAVVRLVREHIERSVGFSALNRRVGEQVQFGDSESAMELLRTFEKDEAKISTEVQTQFDNALDELKLAAKKGSLGRSSRVKRLKG